jgi:hypothetical protein
VSLPGSESKRTEERFPTNIPVKIRAINGTDWYQGRLVNMSKSGACLEGRFTRKVGTAIEVYLTSSLHNMPNHCILASIVWASGEKTGLRFIFSK